jgi:hypothetical protein
MFICLYSRHVVSFILGLTRYAGFQQPFALYGKSASIQTHYTPRQIKLAHIVGAIDNRLCLFESPYRCLEIPGLSDFHEPAIDADRTRGISDCRSFRSGPLPSLTSLPSSRSEKFMPAPTAAQALETLRELGFRLSTDTGSYRLIRVSSSAQAALYSLNGNSPQSARSRRDGSIKPERDL